MIRAAYGRPAGCSGVRVLVARQWPRGCGADAFHVRAPELAPSKRLLARRMDGMSDAEFERAYRRELAEAAQRRTLAEMRRLTCEYGIVLCYGPEGRYYHDILAAVISGNRSLPRILTPNVP